MSARVYSVCKHTERFYLPLNMVKARLRLVSSIIKFCLYYDILVEGHIWYPAGIVWVILMYRNFKGFPQRNFAWIVFVS